MPAAFTEITKAVRQSTSKVRGTVKAFRVLGSAHQENGMIYPKGSIVPSPHQLDKMYPNKFRPTIPGAPTEDEANIEVLPANKLAKEIESSGKPIAPAGGVSVPVKHKGPVGRNVTAKFPKAVENDYQVYKFELMFHVFDKDNQERPLNSEPLKRDEVDSFIAGWLKEH